MKLMLLVLALGLIPFCAGAQAHKNNTSKKKTYYHPANYFGVEGDTSQKETGNTQRETANNVASQEPTKEAVIKQKTTVRRQEKKTSVAANEKHMADTVNKKRIAILEKRAPEKIVQRQEKVATAERHTARKKTINETPPQSSADNTLPVANNDTPMQANTARMPAWKPLPPAPGIEKVVKKKHAIVYSFDSTKN